MFVNTKFSGFFATVLILLITRLLRIDGACSAWSLC